MHRPAIFAILIAAALANLALWAVPNRPVTVASPPGGKLLSISFAPFRDGQSPLTRRYPSADEIEQDLRLIAGQAAGVRTYTSLEGMESVPALARKYGLTVTLGVWLGITPLLNELEVTSAITLANQYPDVVKRVIVGNEVLLRNDLSPAQLAGYITRVKRSIRQPVSTADVWEYWLRYPEMAGLVDFITIHLLPYWENNPAGVDTAAARVLDAYQQIATRFPGKPILVGEAGWPTAGRSRGPAVPGVVNKARFDAAFMAVATAHAFDYNLIEAFDQHWKIKQEGTVGGTWGLYTAGRSPKYTVGEPVVEDPGWPWKAGLATALMLGIMAWMLRRRPTLAPGGVAALALFAQAFAAALVHAADIALSWHFYPQDLALAALMLVLQAVLGAGILVRIAKLWSRPAVLHDASEPDPAEGAALVFLSGKAMTVLSGLAVLWTALLIADGRYRDFPIAPYLIPALGLFGLGLCRAARRPAGCDLAAALSASHLLGTYAQTAGAATLRRSLAAALATVPLAAALAILLPLGALGIVVREGTINHEAMAWAALLATLACPWLATVLATRRGTEPLPPGRHL
ncbi:MAG: glycosyl hydrolase family 17 protein [Rhodospirillaceae bacterium]